MAESKKTNLSSEELKQVSGGVAFFGKESFLQSVLPVQKDSAASNEPGAENKNVPANNL